MTQQGEGEEAEFQRPSLISTGRKARRFCVSTRNEPKSVTVAISILGFRVPPMLRTLIQLRGAPAPKARAQPASMPYAAHSTTACTPTSAQAPTSRCSPRRAPIRAACHQFDRGPRLRADCRGPPPIQPDAFSFSSEGTLLLPSILI